MRLFNMSVGGTLGLETLNIIRGKNSYYALKIVKNPDGSNSEKPADLRTMAD
jgi:hypothetical protein